MAKLEEELDLFEALESAALQLPRGERARLTERLLASLDDDPRIEQAWADEIAERLRAYRAGEMRTFSEEEASQRIADLLR
ncbi:MAG TPA: addiction module protein [Longimicrobium sp.]